MEVLVAATLLGLTTVAGVVGLNASGAGADRAIQQARAQCVVRAEVEAITSAPWGTYGVPAGPDWSLRLNQQPAYSGIANLANITVTYVHVSTGWTYSVTFLKANLSSSGSPDGAAPAWNDVGKGC